MHMLVTGQNFSNWAPIFRQGAGASSGYVTVYDMGLFAQQQHAVFWLVFRQM
jgi:hypothetical protein